MGKPGIDMFDVGDIVFLRSADQLTGDFKDHVSVLRAVFESDGPFRVVDIVPAMDPSDSAFHPQLLSLADEDGVTIESFGVVHFNGRFFRQAIVEAATRQVVVTASQLKAWTERIQLALGEWAARSPEVKMVQDEVRAAGVPRSKIVLEGSVSVLENDSVHVLVVNDLPLDSEIDFPATGKPN